MDINIDNIWNSVKKNAGNAKNIAELRIKLGKANNELSELYRSLGCLCYQHCAAEHADEEAQGKEEADIALLRESITQKLSDIAFIKQELSRIEGNTECPGCRKNVSADYIFCPHCGTKLPENKYSSAEAETSEKDEDMYVEITDFEVTDDETADVESADSNISESETGIGETSDNIQDNSSGEIKN